MKRPTLLRFAHFPLAAATLLLASPSLIAQNEDPGALEELPPSVVTPSPTRAPAAPARRSVPAPEPVEATTAVATRSEERVARVLPAVGVISEAEILRVAPLSIDDLIRTEPNVSTLGGPRYLGEQVVIRGEGGNAVTVRVDQARQNFVSGHAGQRFFIEPHFLHQIDVLRGGGSFLYGSGSAGVLNLSTLDPEHILAEGRATGLRVRNEYHTNSKEWANSVIGAVAAENFEFMIGASDRLGGNLRLADGVEMPDSAIARDSKIAKMVWSPSDEHRFELSVTDYQSLDQGGANPQGNASATGNPLVGREIGFLQWVASYQFNPAGNDLVDLTVVGYHNQTSQVRNYLDPAGSNVGRRNRHELEVTGFEIYNRSVFEFGGLEHRLVAGIDFYTEQQEGFDTRATFFTPGAPNSAGNRPNAEAEHFAAYIADEAQVTDRLRLFAGVRFDRYETSKLSGLALSQQGDAISPNIGFDLGITERFSLVGRYTKAFNQPTLNDFYADGSHFGVVPNDPFAQVTPPEVRVTPAPPGVFPPIPTIDFFSGLLKFNYFEEVFIPNEQLLPETSDLFELGLNYDNDDFFGGRASGRLTGFYKLGENTFDSEITGFRTVSPYSGFANPTAASADTFPNGSPVFNIEGELTQALRQTVNRAETDIHGLEFAFDYDAEVWFASLNAGTLRGSDRNTGRKLNSITGDQLALTVGIRPFESVEIGAYGIWNGGREKRVDNPFSMTSAYDIYGIFAGYRPTENWQLRIGIDNLFDQAYERTSILQQEPGRNVVFSSTLYW